MSASVSRERTGRLTSIVSSVTSSAVDPLNGGSCFMILEHQWKSPIGNRSFRRLNKKKGSLVDTVYRIPSGIKASTVAAVTCIPDGVPAAVI